MRPIPGIKADGRNLSFPTKCSSVPLAGRTCWLHGPWVLSVHLHFSPAISLFSFYSYVADLPVASSAKPSWGVSEAHLKSELGWQTVEGDPMVRHKYCSKWPWDRPILLPIDQTIILPAPGELFLRASIERLV